MQAEKIIENGAQNKRDAFGEAYDLYAAHLYRFISFRIGHTHDAEDILSNVFLNSFETLTQGTRVKHLRAFLYQTARNAIIDYFRKKARTQEYELTLGGSEEHEHEEAPLSIDAHGDLARVKGGILKLKPEYQEVIELRYIEELEIREIAFALGKSHVGVRVLLHRALRALRKHLGIMP